MIKKLPINAVRCQRQGSERSPGGGPGNHCSILPWRIQWTEKPDWGAMVHRVTKSQSDRTEVTSHACTLGVSQSHPWRNELSLSSAVNEEPICTCSYKTLTSAVDLRLVRHHVAQPPLQLGVAT